MKHLCEHCGRERRFRLDGHLVDGVGVGGTLLRRLGLPGRHMLVCNRCVDAFEKAWAHGTAAPPQNLTNAIEDRLAGHDARLRDSDTGTCRELPRGCGAPCPHRVTGLAWPDPRGTAKTVRQPFSPRPPAPPGPRETGTRIPLGPERQASPRRPRTGAPPRPREPSPRQGQSTGLPTFTIPATAASCTPGLGPSRSG